jgi:hypothetical protein
VTLDLHFKAALDNRVPCEFRERALREFVYLQKPLALFSYDWQQSYMSGYAVFFQQRFLKFIEVKLRS